jgi:hypothetical protein
MVTIVDLRLRPLQVLHFHVSPSTSSGQHNCASWPQLGGETTKSIRGMCWHGGGGEFPRWSLHSLHLHRGMRTLDAPHREVRKVAKNLTLLNMVDFHAHHCWYSTHCPNLLYVYQTKNHQIPQIIVTLEISFSVSRSFSCLLLDAAIFTARRL